MKYRRLGDTIVYIGALYVALFALWLLRDIPGETWGIPSAYLFQGIGATVLVVGFLWIHVFKPRIQRRRVSAEAQAYACAFQATVESDMRRIDSMFGR